MTNSYKTGTVSVTNGSADFVGSGTAWSIENVIGGRISIGTWEAEIVTAPDNAHLTTDVAYTGATASGLPYRIWLQDAQAASNIIINRKLNEIIARIDTGTFLDFDATGTLAERAAYNTASAGFIYAQVDVSPFLVYVKLSAMSGDWSAGTALQGPVGAGLQWIGGGWLTAAEYHVNEALTYNGASYRCILDHTSAATSTPGTGATWTTYWALIAAAGVTGATGPAVAVNLRYSSTLTDADPTNGYMRFNAAVVAGAPTFLYIDNLEFGGSDIQAWVQAFDDSTSTNGKGFLYIRGVTTQTAWGVFEITGDVIEAVGYKKVPVVKLAAGGSWANAATFAVEFAPSGNNGSITGVSAFMQTVLDDTSASAAQTTLGISTFIKTLLDDADAATALATLGANNSSNQSTGTLPDARLPDRLVIGALQQNANLAILSGEYYLNAPGTATNYPDTVNWWRLKVRASFGVIFQTAFRGNTTAAQTYYRDSIDSGATWSAWEAIDTRRPHFDSRYAKLAGANVFTVNQRISGTWAALDLNKPASGTGCQIVSYTNNVLRWSITMGTGTAESGSNAGSDFTISRYNDAGAFIDIPFSINRATGQVNISGYLSTLGNDARYAQLGGATFTGNIKVSQSIETSSLYTVVGPSGAAGSVIFLRPNGIASSVQQVAIDAAGGFTHNGNQIHHDGNAARRPQAAAGNGQFLAISTAAGASFTLPAGGTWVAVYTVITTAGASSGGMYSGVYPGGQVIAGIAGYYINGWAWRISE